MKVSIIISTYNRPEKLKKAIESVIAQSYTDWELIVVMDGQEGGMLPKIDNKDGKILFVSIPHFGNHSRPKNIGIKASTGDLICFLDDDNQFRPDHIQALVNAFKVNPDVDVVFGDRWIIDEQGVLPSRQGTTSEFNGYILMRRNFIDTSDFMIKREAMFKLGGWNEAEKRMLDWELMVRAFKAGMKIKRVPLILTDYYLHSDQLSHSMDGLTEEGNPTWSPYDIDIRLPYLGEVREPKVAIYSLTYDRLEETKAGFESLYKTADYPFDHFVVDNGSKDGTKEWLTDFQLKNGTAFVGYNNINKGISIASNQALNEISKAHYDIIVKVDNDAVFLTDGWLKKMVDLWKSNHRLALSCYVQGLRDSPGGAPRVAGGTIKGEMIGITKHLGGICHFVDASAYDNFRWDETSFLHGVQDLEFSKYLNDNGYQMGYLENWFVNHGTVGTQGQEEKYKDYFKRRKLEKVTKPHIEKDYTKIQEEESAYSRGTIWGDRIKDTLEKYGQYLEGRVLDIGCGDGLAMEIIQNIGHEVSGIDISAPKVRICKRYELDAYEGRMEELPFSNKEFGTIFCSHTLEHAEDLDRACKEIMRVAKRAVIIVPIEEETKNPGHTSNIPNADFILKKFTNAELVFQTELNRLERELVLVLDFKND